MNSRKFKFWLATATAMNLGIASQAMASGFEKSVPWGGRSAGVAGIATPYIQGSEALWFNPAGLVSDKQQQDISFNISPTWSKFEGPVYTAQGGVKQATGKQTLITPFGLIYGNTPTENFGFGIGGYVSGGANAVFEDLDFSPRVIRPGIKTKIQIIELALGAGYKVTPELKLGASYRIAFVTANFAALAYDIPAAGAIVDVTSGDLTDTKATGFKLGAQYQAAENVRLGLTFRSDIQFEAKGDFTAEADTGGATTTKTASSSVTARSRLPMAITAGGQWDVVPNEWRLLGEYAFTNYSKVDRIALEGTIPGVGALRDIETHWKDQHNVRVAGEYLGMMMPIRVGYIWTNQVTDAGYARPTFTPPGAAHTFTIGTGYAVNIMDQPLQLDIAGEYTRVTGDGDAASPQAKSSPEGEYKTNAYALHFGATYAF